MGGEAKQYTLPPNVSVNENNVIYNLDILVRGVSVHVSTLQV